MKVLRNYLFQTLLFVLSVVLMQSCSCKGGADLEEKLAAVASDSTQFVLTSNFERFFSQTDIEVKGDDVVLPDYIQNSINTLLRKTSRDDINTFFKDLKGVEYNNFVFVTNLVNGLPEMAFVFSLTDENELAKSLALIDSSNKTEELKGYKLIGSRRTQIVVKDNLAYLVLDAGGPLAGIKAIDMVERFNATSASKPLQAWKKDYLTRDNVFNFLGATGWFVKNISRMNKLYSVANLKALGLEGLNEGYVGIDGNLDGQTAKMSIDLFDKEGKGLKNPYKGKFNSDLLRYVASSDILALSVSPSNSYYKLLQKSLPDYVDALNGMPNGAYDLIRVRRWDSILSGWFDFAANYISDGGMLLAMGLAPDVSLARLSRPAMADFNVVFAADLQSGKAQEGYNYFCGKIGELMGGRANTSAEEKNGMKITTFTLREVVDYDMRTDAEIYETSTIKVALDGNIVVVSTGEIEKKEQTPFNQKLFQESTLCAQVVINDKTPLVAELGFPFGATATLVAKEFRTEIEVSVTGTDKHILDAILSFVTGTY